MEEQEKKKKPWLFIFFTIFIFYLLSPGPMVYLLVKFKLTNDSIVKAVRIIYYPHLIIANKFSFYGEYLKYCEKER